MTNPPQKKTTPALSHLIGIDAGFQGMGYAVIDSSAHFLAAGAFRTKRTAKKRKLRVADDDVDRCQYLTRQLYDLFEYYPPTAVFVELPHAGAKGARANRAMGMATALIVSILEAHTIPVSYLIPIDVRKKLCGRLSASKEEAAQVVLDAWPDVQWPTVKAEREHALDAMAALMASKDDPLYRMALNGR